MVEFDNNTIISILVIHLIAMKNLFALLLCLGMTSSLLAQAPNMNYDPDWDGDGSLGVSDLLGFLALFGDFDTDGDGIWDSVDQCVDMEACNFDSNPSVPCTYLDVIGICGGWCESDENEDGICDFTCGVDSIAYHGYSYATVQIGEQCWFAENLRSELYSNGDSIPELWGSEVWSATTEGAQNFFGENEANLLLYGRLYNYFAVEDSRGVCPVSWHVPTDEEFMTLELEIGMSENMVETEGWRETDNEGIKLMSENWWIGTDEFGFSALPAGGGGGGFSGQGNWTSYWCSLPNTYYQRTRHLQSNIPGISRYWSYEWAGLSIRCIKD
jgi:uncharacterized protein (TIGR02145 family)